MNIWHPDYGIPTDLRLRAVAFARQYGKEAAMEQFNVSRATIYKWIKQMRDANYAVD